MPLPRLDGGGVREQKEKEIMQGGDFLAKIAALHWCPKAIQIRTSFICCGLNIVKSNRACTVLEIIGQQQFIVIQEYCVDKCINQHSAVLHIGNIQLAEAVQPKSHKLSRDFWLLQLFFLNPHK